MAKSDDSHFNPTEGDSSPRELDAAHPAPRITDSCIGRMFGAARGRGLSGTWVAPAPEELQRVLPQFEIFDLIGRGGMGAVYKGRQRSLDRYVAIKILPGEFASGDLEYAVRFQREARAMARLSHPCIVTVHDAGETPGGLLYFVMDYIQGTDVQQLVAAQGRLPVERALAITSSVCEALDYAHRHGVIHRDIKPSNVMVDSTGQVKVADFGLAKLVSTDSALLTATDAMMGTPDFMAPESLLGTAHVDHRADLYAVGVMLYQMLTGKLPRGRFEPPSRLVPGLDRRLDAIVDRTLQNERDARYSGAIELRSALEPVLTRSLALRKPATSATSPARKVQLLIGAFAVAVCVTGGWLLRESDRKKRASSPHHPASAMPPTSAASLAEATQEVPFVNTLGMRFVPVPIVGGPTGGQRVLFSVWETRVQDYQIFASETMRSFPTPPSEGPTFPIGNVTWDDAHAFCGWLTERERKAGKLGVHELYRLPRDHEWSCAVGIGEQEDAAVVPHLKNQRLPNVYPWGTTWPPPAGVGNLRGEERGIESGLSPVPGYRDDFLTASPVGSFLPERFGLYDLAGNVAEWCEDRYDDPPEEGIRRGGTFADHDRAFYLSSKRRHEPPTKRVGLGGFRCVLAVNAPGARLPEAEALKLVGVRTEEKAQFPRGRWMKLPASSSWPILSGNPKYPNPGKIAAAGENSPSATFKDVEVMPPDGLPEAEARTLAGLDVP